MSTVPMTMSAVPPSAPEVFGAAFGQLWLLVTKICRLPQALLELRLAAVHVTMYWSLPLQDAWLKGIEVRLLPPPLKPRDTVWARAGLDRTSRTSPARRGVGIRPRDSKGGASCRAPHREEDAASLGSTRQPRAAPPVNLSQVPGSPDRPPRGTTGPWPPHCRWPPPAPARPGCRRRSGCAPRGWHRRRSPASAWGRRGPRACR